MALLTDIKSDSGFVPSGCVFPFAGSSAPTGWLLCDGAAYSTTAYANLFSAISTTYATQINPTTGVAWAAPAGGNFRVPDLRGVFLRGAGTPSGLDAVSIGGYQIQKTSRPTANFTVDTATVTVSGTTSSGSASTWLTQVTGGGDNTADWTGHVIKRGSNLSGGTGDGTYPGKDHNHTWSATSGNTTAQTVAGGGDNETRPLNRGVNYIIKI